MSQKMTTQDLCRSLRACALCRRHVRLHPSFRCSVLIQQRSIAPNSSLMVGELVVWFRKPHGLGAGSMVQEVGYQELLERRVSAVR